MAISRDFYGGIRDKRAICREISFCCISYLMDVVKLNSVMYDSDSVAS